MGELARGAWTELRDEIYSFHERFDQLLYSEQTLEGRDLEPDPVLAVLLRASDSLGDACAMELIQARERQSDQNDGAGGPEQIDHAVAQLTAAADIDLMLAGDALALEQSSADFSSGEFQPHQLWELKRAIAGELISSVDSLFADEDEGGTTPPETPPVAPNFPVKQWEEESSGFGSSGFGRTTESDVDATDEDMRVLVPTEFLLPLIRGGQPEGTPVARAIDDSVEIANELVEAGAGSCVGLIAEIANPLSHLGLALDEVIQLSETPNALLTPAHGVSWITGRVLGFLGRHMSKMMATVGDKWPDLVKLIGKFGIGQLVTSIARLVEGRVRWAIDFSDFLQELVGATTALPSGWDGEAALLRDLHALEKGCLKRLGWISVGAPILATFAGPLTVALGPTIPLTIAVVAILCVTYSLRDRLDTLPDSWPIQVQGIPSIMRANA